MVGLAIAAAPAPMMKSRRRIMRFSRGEIRLEVASRMPS
jgi:hypothetical protein